MPGVRAKLTGTVLVAHSDDLQLPPGPRAMGTSFLRVFSPCPNLTLEASLDTQRKWEVRGQPTFPFKSLEVLSHSLLLLASWPGPQIIWLPPKGVGGPKFSTRARPILVLHCPLP